VAKEEEKRGICLFYAQIVYIAFASAIQTNTKRLENECQAYVNAVKREEDQFRRIRRVIAANVALEYSKDERNKGSEEQDGKEEKKQIPEEEDLIRSTIKSFQSEIASLQEACHQHEQELKDIQTHLSEQSIRSNTLYISEQNLLADLNNLELHSKVFQSTNKTLSHQYQSTQDEVDALSCISLPSLLFDVVIDDRGLRYPLINELRLAYRPKGDLKWKEMDVAWSQAAQLLMFVGGVVNFVPPPQQQQGEEASFRIVPLASRAKIIHNTNTTTTPATCDAHGNDAKRKKIVYTLGRNSGGSSGASRSKGAMGSSLRNLMKRGGGDRDAIATEALRAFHSLLRQIIMHVTSSPHNGMPILSTTTNITSCTEPINTPPPPPFEMTQTKIGAHDLSKLQERDDSSWSAVIHGMAANLKWLAEYTHQFSTAIAQTSLVSTTSSSSMEFNHSTTDSTNIVLSNKMISTSIASSSSSFMGRVHHSAMLGK